MRAMILFLVCFCCSSEAMAGIPMIDSEANLEIDKLENVPVSALMTASANGDAMKIVQLIAEGSNVNERTIQGETPLMFASRYGKLNAVNILLHHHADPNMQTYDGRNTALIFAAYKAGPKVVQFLLEHGADPNILPAVKDPLGNPPALEVAVEAGRIENVSILLKHGAKMRNALGSAILWLSDPSKKESMVKLLTEHGATVRGNIPMLLEVKRVASPDIRKMLDLDKYKLLGKNDEIYPDSLDELADSDGLARKLFENHNFSIMRDLPINLRPDLKAYTFLEINVLKNAIYARHGYIFQTAWLRNYFITNFSAYHPVEKNVSLSKIDKENLAFIQSSRSNTQQESNGLGSQ